MQTNARLSFAARICKLAVIIICATLTSSVFLAWSQPAPPLRSRAAPNPQKRQEPPPAQTKATQPQRPAPPSATVAPPPLRMPPPAAPPPVDTSQPPPSLPRASRERMRACAEEWDKRKRETAAGLPMWRDFANDCLMR